MNKTFASSLCLLVVLAAPAAGATCIYPRPPENLPDGATATYDQMVEAQRVVKQFDADITAYTACLQMELDAILGSVEIDDARKAELQAMQVKKNNAAVDEAQAIADRFNEQVRVFKEKNKKQ